MISMTSKIAAACLMALAATAAVAAEPEVECSLGHSKVFLGESVRYRVAVKNVEKPSWPKLGDLDDFDVRSVGRPSVSSNSVTTIIGSKTTQVVNRSVVYNYSLTPKQVGTFTIPAPTVKVDGKTLHGNALSVEVVGPNSGQGASFDDPVKMEITVSPKNVYPTQRLTVTLSVWVRALPGEYARRNPLSIQQSAPKLTIPWADDGGTPDGLEPVEQTNAWLSQLRDLRGEGFRINNYVEGFSSMFFEDRELTFQPQPRRVVRTDSSGKEVEYWLYTFERSYTAKRAGAYGFGPASLKGVFASGVDARGRLEGDELYVVAPRLEVRVKQVPDEGRPASYLGVIGRCTWSAEMKPTKCKVGDPITLTLTLRGRGSIDAAVAPDLADVPGVAKNFKTYEGTREFKGDTCQFTYTVRPLNDKITEFPSVPGAYYDVARERYVTLETKPIPMTVSAAPTLANGGILGGGGGSRAHDELQVRREGIFANVTDPGELRNEAVHPGYWLAGLGGLAGLYGLVAGATWLVRRRMSNPAAVRRRSAVSRARRRLREGTDLLKGSDTQRGAEEVRGALVGLIADVADIPEAGMTSAEACRRLRKLGVDETLLGRLTHSLEACDAARYASTGSGVNGLATEADELLDGVVHSLKKQRCLR